MEVVKCQPYAPAAFTPQEIFLVLISLESWVDPAIVRNMPMKNFKETIGNRTRDLPAYGAMPHPTASPRALHLLDVRKTTNNITDTVVWRGERRDINNTGIVCTYRRAMKRTCALCNPVVIDGTLTTYSTVYYIVMKAVNCVLSETTLRDLETTIPAEYLGQNGNT